MNIISSLKLPVAVGPYSQAVEANGLIFCSGQIAIDFETGGVVEEGIVEQTKFILNNIQNFLEDQNLSLKNVAKVTVFLKDMNDFVDMNEIYASYFTEHKPARSTVEVARLPKDVKIEVEVIVSRN